MASSKWYSVKKHLDNKGLGTSNGSEWSDNKIKMNDDRYVSIWKFKGNDTCFQYRVCENDEGDFYVETWDGWSISRKKATWERHFVPTQYSKPKEIAAALEFFIDTEYKFLRETTKMDSVWD